MAPPPKRPGTMSDDERARVGERYRKQTPAFGVPDTGDTASLERRVDSIESTLDEKFGKSRKNGDFSTLKGRLDTFTSRAWAVVLLLLGGLAGAAVKLIIVGRAYGEIETRIQAHQGRLQLIETVLFLKSLPATSPDKELLP